MMTQQKNKYHSQKGQSIVEYVILVAVVIAALIVFLGRGGIFERSYEKSISGQGDDIKAMADKIFN